MKKYLLPCIVSAFMLYGCSNNGQVRSFETDYFKIDIDSRGYITGMWNTTRESRNFSPADQPSPLLALYDGSLKRYYYPHKATYDRGNKQLRLEYENGSTAVVGIEEKNEYIKLTLKQLENREKIAGIDDHFLNIFLR